MCPLRAALATARGRCATALVAESGHHTGERGTLAGSHPGSRDEANTHSSRLSRCRRQTGAAYGTFVIATRRGSPIDVIGASDLAVRNTEGTRQRLLNADQVVYLASGRDAAPRQGDRAGLGPPAGCRPGGGLQHRRESAQARHLRVLGLPGGLDRSAGRQLELPPQVPAVRRDGSLTGGRPVRRGGVEPGIPRLDGRGDPPGAQRVRGVSHDRRRAAAGSRRARSGRGNGSRRRPPLAPGAESRAESRAEERLDIVRSAVRDAFAARALAITPALRTWLDEVDQAPDAAAIIRLA